jgi:isopentenyldiphosphate isomerase
MQHEELEIVSEHNNTPTGVYLPRPTAIREQAWCRSTNVFVMNPKGEILCHQRSMKKERLPGVWSTHLGGHVGRGETYETNAVKELEEEAGIKAEPTEILPWRTTKIPTARLWVRDFVTVFDAPLDELVPQPGEVDQFTWKNFNEIMEHLNQEPSKWVAGVHDFKTEYYCMRAVLAAAQAAGLHRTSHDLHVWHV